ncbi:sugar ABC transporter permease [Nostoc sp. FACHB-87]|uniref:Sugar ABC transporter permease n=1 Tax=Nostoc spongiaeforme FACHB-130 TaxID=1357510 RepID=A0ABR8G1F4_9NOSO|nr:MULTISPECIES: sugar ABC transporter permease [Nostocales]MBD2297685.1 sugar ABC transporter permease [Nostoc sp. FACHB-190]MBD2454733.1 sugar ABC transporter permease [Nostoc sp. FACHB-87]MBD2476811.1 sugar ABC transporter permease [Anabaena sp. FACHB-83]MBD2487436.1 sugar ABC transporter permease [Aulosira sp. FACHB-615]MBD2597075.1 sugar ABC transporter permease [Nostoc spongiaeforme FACHB-130]
MVTTSNVQVTVSLTELGLDDEELQAQVQNLLPQLREVDGVEDADLVAVTDVPEGSKALGGFLLGFLNAEVNPKNLKALFGFLGDRFGNKPIKILVKAPDGREINIEASSREEFDFAYQKAQEFLNNSSNSNNG